MRDMFSLCKCNQKRIHFFWLVLVLCFIFLIRLGYRAVLTHYKAYVSVLVPKKLFLWQRNCSLLLILLITLRAIASPDIVSSIRRPKYLTLECCLICISPYFLLRFYRFFLLSLEAKSIGFVLFLPNWILSLLSTNQLHILEKSTFNCFWVSLIYLCWQTSGESSA